MKRPSEPRDWQTFYENGLMGIMAGLIVALFLAAYFLSKR